MFTIVLIALAAIAVVVIVAHEIWAWRRPGHHISLQASSDSGRNNMGGLTQQTNIHNDSSSGGATGPMSN